MEDRADGGVAILEHLMSTRLVCGIGSVLRLNTSLAPLTMSGGECLY